MAETLNCDVAILGGGLAGGLIALALAARRPNIKVLLIEEAPSSAAIMSGRSSKAT
jgi:lycopene beta-cyclase